MSKQKIYELLQSSNTELAWQLDKGQGYGIKKRLEKVFKLFLGKYTLDELFTEDQLWLYNIGLYSIPSKIGLLPQLKVLSLSDNNLTSIPKVIGQLTQLRTLDLSNNNLTSIPKELGKLSQLEWLSLSDNNLTEIPKELDNLSQLEWLHLNGNPLPQQEVDKIRKMLPICKVFY